MRTLRWTIVATLIGGLAWAADRFSPEQLSARYYNDLGPSRIDVSAYPPEHQQAYASFEEHCSACHTLARPINAPIVARKDWSRFVQRMHMRSKAKTGAGFYKVEAKAIVDFLAYDAKLRKVEHKAEFDAQTKELKALFDEVKKEGLRVREADNRKKAKTRDQASPPGQ